MPDKQPTIAFCTWVHVLEDLLDMTGISFETFRTEFMGSYVFGYVKALQSAGIRTVLVYMSSRVKRPFRCTHVPTGATICLLPTNILYRIARRKMSYPYGQTTAEMFGPQHGWRRALLPAYWVTRELVFYLTTPPVGLARELIRERCDALLCQEYESPRFDVCVALGKLLRLPVFATFQGGDYHHCRLERRVRPLSLRGCRGLIVAPRSEAERIRTRYGVDPARIRRIFNPVDVDVWYPEDRAAARAALGVAPGVELVAWHGRVAVDKKGLDLLLDAWTRVCLARPDRDLRLLLVGSGDEAPELLRRLEACRVPGVIWIDRFVNDQATLRQYLSAADVYAFTSRYEGCPVAPVEAMACGLPVVATDVTGMPDILEGGEASGGQLVPRDDARALAREIGQLLDHPQLARELGARARRRVEACFSIDSVGRQLHDLMFQQA